MIVVMSQIVLLW